MSSLTEYERHVMEVCVEGNSLKGIGLLLGATPRTFEGHREKVMMKVEALSLPDLVRKVMDINRVNH